MSEWTAEAPYHSSPTQSLGPVYRQTAGLEMAWCRVLETIPATISGEWIEPLFMDGDEAHDINTEDDWREAERIAATLMTYADTP